MQTFLMVVSLFALGTLASPAALSPRNAAPINSGATALIEKLEVYKANFYYIGGHKTIGYGHDCVEQKDCGSITPPLSKAQAYDLLEHDLPQFETCVCKLANADGLNANQYGALVSFAFNSGCGGVHKFFNEYTKAKNYKGICEALPHTNLHGTEYVSRRRQEGAFCREATTEMSGCAGKVSPSPKPSSTKPPTTPKPSSTKPPTTPKPSSKKPSTTPKPTPTKPPKTPKPPKSPKPPKTSKSQTMGALETQVLKKDEIDKYIMAALAA